MPTYQEPTEIDPVNPPETLSVEEAQAAKPRKRTPRKRAAPTPGVDAIADSDHYTPRTAAVTGQNRVAGEFARRYQGILIHVDRIGWHEWVESHWRWVSEKRPLGAVQDLIRTLLHEAVDLGPQTRDQWLMDIRKCETASGMLGVVKLAACAREISVDPEQLDGRPDLLAFQNGTYELLTDIFRESRPEDFGTKVMGCDYDPTAECPTYDRMLSEAQPDPEIRAYLHRQVGSACEGRVGTHMLPVNSGPGGAGKGSTFNDSWLPTFGEYGLALPVEVLLAGKKDYMTERLSLKGARYVITSEPPAAARFNSGLMKLVAGGDKMSCRPLYSNKLVEWEPTHQIFMMCNHRPVPPADDDAVWRRLKSVQWLNKVPEDRMDPGMPKALAGELAGIANRVLAGWRDYRDNGLQEPESTIRARKEWQVEVDVLGSFLDDKCYVDRDDLRIGVKSSLLFLKWTSFCADAGEHSGTQIEFTAAMKAKGFGTKRSNGMHFVGVGLNPDA